MHFQFFHAFCFVRLFPHFPLLCERLSLCRVTQHFFLCGSGLYFWNNWPHFLWDLVFVDFGDISLMTCLWLFLPVTSLGGLRQRPRLQADFSPKFQKLLWTFDHLLSLLILSQGIIKMCQLFVFHTASECCFKYPRIDLERKYREMRV